MLEAQPLGQYLSETLHEPVRLQTWEGSPALPAYLRRYQFFNGVIGGVPVLLLGAQEELTPTTARKHILALQEYWDGTIALAFPGITSRGRQRLVNAGLPFVVPQSQIYLPTLGLCLTSRFKQKARTLSRLRPSAQLLLLYLLQEPGRILETPGEAARELGYTAVAMGQALDQLQTAGLVRTRKVGRTRSFQLAGDKADVWQRAQPYLSSPVRKKCYSLARPHGPGEVREAGLSALARYSALSEPPTRVLAQSWTPAASAQDQCDNIDPDEVTVEIEFWDYAPQGLSAGPAADRLSVYLSLRHDPDERVQAALEQMMEDLEW